MAFGKEIKRLRDLAGLSSEKMAQVLGIDKVERYRNWEKRDANPKFEDLNRIEQIFEMPLPNIFHLKALPKKIMIMAEGREESNFVEEHQEWYIEKRRAKKNENAEDIPVSGGNTSLGNIEVVDQDYEKNEIIATLPANMFPGCNHAEKAKGDSMYPLIMNQAWLVGKKGIAEGITYGEKYIIRTTKGLDTAKYIHPGSSKSKVLLRAYNKSVPDQEININEINFVCRVYWIINPT